MRTRITVGRLMLGVAALGLVLALLRVNLALGSVVGCLACATAIRTARILRSSGPATPKPSPWRVIRVLARSLLASAAVIGSADLTFMLVQGTCDIPRRLHSLPRVRAGSVAVAGACGLAVGYLVRRTVWEPRIWTRPPT